MTRSIYELLSDLPRSYNAIGERLPFAKAHGSVVQRAEQLAYDHSKFSAKKQTREHDRVIFTPYVTTQLTDHSKHYG